MLWMWRRFWFGWDLVVSAMYVVIESGMRGEGEGCCFRRSISVRVA